MPTTALDKITVGGPCKIIDPNGTIYTDGDVTVTPKPVRRAIGSSVGGEGDDSLVDLTYEVRAKNPKSIWSSPYQAVLLPNAYTNWTVSGGLMCGLANRSVAIVGADAKGFTFTRACLEDPVDVFLGLGGNLWASDAVWTSYIGQGKALTDADAFMVENTTAWDQSDFPTGHQEVICTGAWTGQTGWDTVWAEKGFKLTHELKKESIFSGSVTVDKKITSYRPMMSFTPQQPTTTQLLTGFSLVLGNRRSTNAHDFAVAGSGISVTVKAGAVFKGDFVFDNKKNRHGEFGMISALTAPGTRLVLA